MSGILSYGAYVPYYRLTRKAIGAGRGERAVASYDEDAVSMAVEAGREILPDALENLNSLIFATTSPPYAEKLNAAFSDRCGIYWLSRARKPAHRFYQDTSYRSL